MKLLIVGSGPDWKEAPFEDPSFEVWAYGLAADLFPRVDVAFEIHRRDRWERFGGVDSEVEYTARLNRMGKPIWMQEAYEDIKHSMKYPLEDVEKLVGTQFFGTLSYQLGLAALYQSRKRNIERLLLFGFDLCTWEEWANQRPNANRLVGFLQGMGVQVQVASSSKLFGNPYRYGYELPEENLGAVDALILEGVAQLTSMMGRLADLYIAKKEAARFVNVKGK